MEIEHRDADGPGNPDSSYGVHVPAVHATWSTLDTDYCIAAELECREALCPSSDVHHTYFRVQQSSAVRHLTLDLIW